MAIVTTGASAAASGMSAAKANALTTVTTKITDVCPMRSITRPCTGSDPAAARE